MPTASASRSKCSSRSESLTPVQQPAQELTSVSPHRRFTFPDPQATPDSLQPAPLASRKSTTITPPTSDPTPIELATLAVSSLRTVSSLSHGSQLLVKLNVFVNWLDKHDGGSTWANGPFVEWIGTSSVNASALHYRAGVVGWWAEQAGQIPSDEQPPKPKSTALLGTLSAILRSATNLVGLGVGSILAQLTAVLIKREARTAKDPLGPAVLAAIAALGSHIYYFDQANDIVSDLIEALRTVGRGAGPAVDFDGEQRARVMRALVGALALVLEEARQISQEPTPSTSGSPSNGAVERPPLPENMGTVRGNGVLISGNAQGLRSKKESANGSSHKTGGKRNRVSPEVFQESLFLLTDIEPGLRTEYARALTRYVLHEMAFGAEVPSGDEPSADPSREVSRFLQELHAAAYELATSANLGASRLDGDVSPASPTSGNSTPAVAPISPVKIQLQTELQTSRRGSVVEGEPIVATPADYIVLSELLEAVQSRGTALGVLTGLPMLLALDGCVVEAHAEQVDVRFRACRLVAAGGVAAASRTWNIVEVHQVAEEAKTGASMPAGIVVDGFAASTSLQAASGLDQLSLASALGAPWSRDGGARGARSPLLRNPYLHLSAPGGTRSVSNISSTLRLAAAAQADPNGASGARSASRAPSLADLQSSLGASTHSQRSSAAPSIASTSGTVNTYATSRRTARGAAKSVLDRLERLAVGQEDGGRGSRLSSPGASRLSVSGPPYAGTVVAGER